MSHTGDELAHRSHFFGVQELGLQQCCIRDVGHHYHDARDGSGLITHRAQIHGELSQPAVASHDLQIQIVYLMARHRGIQGFTQ